MVRQYNQFFFVEIEYKYIAEVFLNNQVFFKYKL